MGIKDNCHLLEDQDTPIQDIEQDLNTALEEIEPVTTEIQENAAVITTTDRQSERALVTRQELRRTAYVQQLIENGKEAIKNISNMKLDMDNYQSEKYQDAIEILKGTETEILLKLKAALSNKLEAGKVMDSYLEYVKSLL